MMSNEAAERLRSTHSRWDISDHEYAVLLDEALATERRATVERIETAYRRGKGYPSTGTPRTSGDDFVLDILDAEAER
jgi:hypothetical protein